MKLQKGVQKASEGFSEPHILKVEVTIFAISVRMIFVFCNSGKKKIKTILLKEIFFEI